MIWDLKKIFVQEKNVLDIKYERMPLKCLCQALPQMQHLAKIDSIVIWAIK